MNLFFFFLFPFLLLGFWLWLQARKQLIIRASAQINGPNPSQTTILNLVSLFLNQLHWVENRESSIRSKPREKKMEEEPPQELDPASTCPADTTASDPSEDDRTESKPSLNQTEIFRALEVVERDSSAISESFASLFASLRLALSEVLIFLFCLEAKNVWEIEW